MAYESWKVLVQYTAGVWTDITADVDTVRQPVSSTNGATPETTGEPGGMALVLNNVGFKYTPGNTSSTFALRTGMPIRFAEIIAGTTVNLFTGFVEFPETDDVNLSETQSQTIAVNAVDQLSLWERSQTFVSTLGAHIMGTPNLALYYPLIDHGPGFASAAGAYPLTAFTNVMAASGPIGDVVTYAKGDGPPGDDVFVPSFAPAYIAGVGQYAYEFVSGTINLDVAAGQTFTMCAWMRPLTVDSAQSNAEIVSLNGPDFADFFDRPLSTGQSFISSGASNLTLTMPTAYPRDTWRLATLQITTVTGAVSLWVGSDVVVTGTMSGTPPSTLDFQILQIAQFYFGNLAHVQFYIGTIPFSYADHLAQFAIGMTGLERQTTGDRIKTLARYAGKTDGQLVNVDTGCSIMQRARLAGQMVAQAMYEARDTEQGDLYIDGDGNLTFHDRRTILNI